MPDYEKDGFETKEKIRYSIQGLLIIALFSYMFYRSIIAFFILSPMLIFYLKKKRKDCMIQRKQQLGIQFKEFLNAVLSGIQAGYSIENSVMNTYDDMKSLFGEKAVITREILYFRKSLHNNRTLEELLNEFAERSHHQDVIDFAEVFGVAKRSGGNLPNIIKSTSEVIGIRMDVNRKINTLISAKKMEQNIMNFVPFAILLYINATSPGFFDVLYHNLTGIIIMTILLIIYLAAYLLAEKIIQIDI